MSHFIFIFICIYIVFFIIILFSFNLGPDPIFCCCVFRTQRHGPAQAQISSGILACLLLHVVACFMQYPCGHLAKTACIKATSAITLIPLSPPPRSSLRYMKIKIMQGKDEIVALEEPLQDLDRVFPRLRLSLRSNGLMARNKDDINKVKTMKMILPSIPRLI